MIDLFRVQQRGSPIALNPDVDRDVFYSSCLQTSGLVYLLESYHSSRTQRLVKVSKLYFLDTGLCSIP